MLEDLHLDHLNAAYALPVHVALLGQRFFGVGCSHNQDTAKRKFDAKLTVYLTGAFTMKIHQRSAMWKSSDVGQDSEKCRGDLRAELLFRAASMFTRRS